MSSLKIDVEQVSGRSRRLADSARAEPVELEQNDVKTACPFELIMQLPADVGFLEACRRSGLDKATDFMYGDLTGVDFLDEDLTGYDFSGAVLDHCDFSRAKVDGLVYVGADINHTKWPLGYVPDNGPGEPIAAWRVRSGEI